jgi:hypothetical protein
MDGIPQGAMEGGAVMSTGMDGKDCYRQSFCISTIHGDVAHL